MFKKLTTSFKNAVISTLPISLVVIVASLFFPEHITGSLYGLFIIASALLILGLGLFSMGIDMALTPIGREVGSFVTKSKKLWLVILTPLLLGIIITLAEPGVEVLTGFLSDVTSTKFIITLLIAIGVGLFLTISVLRIFFKLQLRFVFLAVYGVIFLLAAIVQFVYPEFVTVSLDGGGVSTGAVTVPFLMAFTVGIATVAHGRKDSEGDENFGSVALCTMGPVFVMLIVGLTGKMKLSSTSSPLDSIKTFNDILLAFGNGFVNNLKDVALSVGPIMLIFVLFQLFALKLKKTQVIRISLGLLYSYIGLTLFLTGVNVGFTPVGQLLGSALASSSVKWILIPVGALVGALIVLAEPSVHALTKQVNEITSGALSRKSMLILLCIGVGFAIAISFLRVLLNLTIWWVLLPVYGACLILMFFAPKIFTGIAFDSGGVASGPMTVTFALPFVIGACGAVGSNVFINAIGVVATVTMMPILIILVSGVVFKVKLRKAELSSDLEALSTAEFEGDLIIDSESGAAEASGDISQVEETETHKKETQIKDAFIIDFFDDEAEDLQYHSELDDMQDMVLDDDEMENNTEESIENTDATNNKNIGGESNNIIDESIENTDIKPNSIDDENIENTDATNNKNIGGESNNIIDESIENTDIKPNSIDDENIENTDAANIENIGVEPNNIIDESIENTDIESNKANDESIENTDIKPNNIENTDVANIENIGDEPSNINDESIENIESNIHNENTNIIDEVSSIEITQDSERKQGALVDNKKDNKD